ncbi:MAG: Endolytic murein transglycosylase [Candidatus Saccharibacteria bacterium]|nr:Endolytic murein transglycosylase [Candidatus Saccharibacteria bacterium]
MPKRQRSSYKTIWKVTMDKRPLNPPPKPIEPPVIPQPIEATETGLVIKKKWSKRRKIVLFSGIGVLLALIIIVLGGVIWYQVSLSPLGSNKNELIKVTIAPNTSPNAIGNLLVEKKIIRSSDAFSVYTRLTGTRNKLQAGIYRLSPSETTPRIVEHLTNGTVDTFDITFLPGATLSENRKVLLDAGYTDEEVEAGLNAVYTSALFDTKPASADLEGYIYGDTYKFGAGATVSDILNYTFETYLGVITKNDLVTKFKARNLTLYQGITLASIIQRESVGGDEAQIAEVFYNRLAQGMVLGSDVTYQYIADKTGVARDPNLDSPYNTRRFAGLPPGPIATPGLASLKAVATPAEGDYLFFLSGDDDVTYFARTNAEHEQNITDHCKVKCSTL